jgi:uncharacterized membrane protein
MATGERFRRFLRAVAYGKPRRPLEPNSPFPWLLRGVAWLMLAVGFAAWAIGIVALATGHKSVAGFFVWLIAVSLLVAPVVRLLAAMSRGEPLELSPTDDV